MSELSAWINAGDLSGRHIGWSLRGELGEITIAHITIDSKRKVRIYTKPTDREIHLYSFDDQVLVSPPAPEPIVVELFPEDINRIDSWFCSMSIYNQTSGDYDILRKLGIFFEK